MKLSILKSSVLLLAVSCIAFAFTVADNWPVPDKAAKTPNPVKATPESIAEGKVLWSKHCQSCHGKAGEGDGSKAAQLKTLPPSFAKAAFQQQSDGAIFYKTSEGRDDMPSFKKKLPEQEDVWNLVNYMRTFKK
ncbi:Cytochrome C oxidase, cbb3-type, subunit III [Filimonas lacunae]|uniref:Cytochrome C oxidase, cbb3-type, subunit III n=1 Tax=Filimonas lacunae TaxID=477680 RepID=A0A173MED0_9BACT|nr:cytochrome c [Filimonas lacunae]BAV05839.1 high-affinity iron permease [Filimonas lacunae]SIT28418.1 Cytochrome C oxidase, cbb3-type, subunit III [Filimonas lacunae]